MSYLSYVIPWEELQTAERLPGTATIFYQGLDIGIRFESLRSTKNP
ncbi:hypothetical protein [Aureispira sp. CCB-E]|nr:hypothetical protein [Aureispira sp. CCB-E]WMX15911.1 hypothetical protein QP953_05870 [Aureispira sp. CCB-E]